MTAKKSTPAHRRTIAGSPERLASHHVEALLHTMRHIAHFEDALCELSHELRGAGELSRKSLNELRDILEEIPAEDYLSDLDVVRESLAVPRPLRKAAPKKAAKSVRGRKRSIGAKKKPGRKSSK